MALTLDRIEVLAPDQASLAAARKLLKPSSWPTLAEAEGLAWRECQGSGSTPYRVVVNEGDAGYKCTCPSRKFPCKHTLALMWMRAEKSVAFTPAPVPDWVKDWLSRRRVTADTTSKSADEAKSKPRPSIHLTDIPDATAQVDPKAEQRAAAARERNRADRESTILAGLEELDVWLSDQVQQGMANFVSQAAQSCRTIAQRLVDAKASGLAGRLDALPTRLFTLPGPVRPSAAIRELGQINLISHAYRRADQLPELLAIPLPVVACSNNFNVDRSKAHRLRMSPSTRILHSKRHFPCSTRSLDSESLNDFSARTLASLAARRRR